MQTLGSAASVVAAIREEAAADVDRIEQMSATETADLQSAAANATITIADRSERLAMARRRIASDLASAEWEGRRAVIEQRETWIASVVKRATEAWRNDRDALLALARASLASLPDGPCDVVIGGNADARFRDDLASASGRPQLTVSATPAMNGCVASCGDVTFDNTIEARARRHETEWRAAISRLYTVEP